MEPYHYSLPLAPILYAQGKYVRKVTLRLPEAAGDRCGRVGTGPALRLLVLGDSAAAGVGVNQQEQALAGRLAAQLSEYYDVTWRLHAKTGNTTTDNIATLQELTGASYDLVVVSTGVNDVTTGVSVKQWCRQLRDLHQRLQQDFNSKLVIYSGVPPMGKFPALPYPLRFFMGKRATMFDHYLQQTVAGLSGAAYVALNHDAAPLDETAIAHDGFHPGAPAYQYWAEQISCRLQQPYWLTGSHR